MFTLLGFLFVYKLEIVRICNAYKTCRQWSRRTLVTPCTSQTDISNAQPPMHVAASKKLALPTIGALVLVGATIGGSRRAPTLPEKMVPNARKAASSTKGEHRSCVSMFNLHLSKSLDLIRSRKY
jgi:hypothetical protein